MGYIAGFVFLVLALFGTPLFLILSSLTLYLFWIFDIEFWSIFIELYGMAQFNTLLAIPLFTFAGYLLAESKTPQRIVKLSSAFLGWLPGGLGIVALFACAFFTAFTGASGVTIIALGGLLYPVMIKDNYDESFTQGLLTSSGSLGLLFPPSLPIILYGMVAQVDIDKLFLAGVLPGILLIFLLSLYSYYKNRDNTKAKVKFEMSKAIEAAKEAAWEIPMPFIILIGIYGGFIHATEAAGILALYVFIVEVFIYKDLSFSKDIPRVMKDSMVLVGSILLILGMALAFTSFLIDEQIPQLILESMSTFIHSKVTFLIALNIFLLIVGFLMDIFSAIFIVVPLILPIAEQFGINPIHLGIIFLTNLEIGYSTPPVGLNLFIASFRFEQPIAKLYKATLPFIFILIIALIIITYVPELSLFLVDYFQ